MQEEQNNENPSTPTTAAQAISDWDNNTVIIEPSVKGAAGEEIRKVPEVEEDVEPETEAEEEEVIEAAPEVQLPENPGEFKPTDYSFEVTLFDDDNKKLKDVKIKSIEQFEELLEADANFGSPAALLKVNRLASKMEADTESDKKDWQKKKDVYDMAKQAADASQEAITSMQNEIQYLVDRGDLPAVDKKYVEADWSDDDVKKQPGVKEQLSLLSYMAKENKARAKAGLKPLTSVVDAFNSWKLDSNKKVEKDTKTQQAQARKDAGARVSGGSPNPVSSAPKGISVGRGGSLRDIGSTNWG